MPPVNRGRWLARSRSVPVFPSSWMKNAVPIPSRPAKLARTSNTELAHGNNTQNQARSTAINAQVAPHAAAPKPTTSGQAPQVSASKDKDPSHPEPPKNLAAPHITLGNANALPKPYTPPTPISRLTPVNRRAPKHLRPVPSLTFTNLGVTQAPTPPSRSSPQRPLSQNIQAPIPAVVRASEPSPLSTLGKLSESRVATAVENTSFDTKDDVRVIVIEETPAVPRSTSILMPLANELKTTEAAPPSKPLADPDQKIMASTEGDHKVPIFQGPHAAAPCVLPETRSSLEKPSDCSAPAPDSTTSASVNVTRHIPEVIHTNTGEVTSGTNPFVRTPVASHRHTRNHSLGISKEVPGEPVPKPEANITDLQIGATKTSRRQNATTEAKPSRIQPPANPPAPITSIPPVKSKHSIKSKHHLPENVDFDTDNEPSWAWDELIRQLDEEEEKYTHQRQALNSDVWWISFELAWEANVRKGRPPRSWLDVERNWPTTQEEDVQLPAPIKDVTPTQPIACAPKARADDDSAKPSKDDTESVRPQPRTEPNSATVQVGSPHDESSSASSSSPSETAYEADWAKVQEDLSQRRAREDNLKGDIWKLWQEAERRWAEEDKLDKLKAQVDSELETDASRIPPPSNLPRMKNQVNGTATRNTRSDRVEAPPPPPVPQYGPTGLAAKEATQKIRQHQEDAHRDAARKEAIRNAQAQAQSREQPRRRQSEADAWSREARFESSFEPKAKVGPAPIPARQPLRVIIPESPIAAAYRAYEARWEALANSTWPITFASVPWPVLHRPYSLGAITMFNIATFLLSPEHSFGIVARERLRAAVRRWHTDKFARYAHRIVREDRQMIDDGVGAVARALTQLLELERQD